MGRKRIYPFYDIAVGESCTHKFHGAESVQKQSRRVRVSASQIKRRTGMEFICITVPDGVWIERTA